VACVKEAMAARVPFNARPPQSFRKVVMRESVPEDHTKPMATILIADDSQFQLAFLRSGLEAKGFEVIGAEDALQASMMALRSKPDAIVLDISMPGGSRLEVVKRLRRSTKTSGIPVVVVTADSDPRTRDTAISLGASAFFYKPINIENLVSKLSELCSQPTPGILSKEGPASSNCEKVVTPTSPDITPVPGSIPGRLRSWREILQELTEEHSPIGLSGKTHPR
jgi:CheY-like chemotaxis protein